MSVRTSAASDTERWTGTDARRRAALAEVPLFSAVGPEARDRVWARSRPGRSRAGEALFVQGDVAETLLVLLTGEVVGVVETANGRSVTVARWAAPCALDKVAVLSGQRHSCSAWVERDCEWRSLPRAVLGDLIDDVPALRRHALRTLARTAASERARRVEAASGTTATRLAGHLLAEVARTGTVQVATTQQQLADVLGVSRVTVSRRLARLARDGLLQTGRNVVHVLSLEGLAAARDGKQ